MAKQSPKNFGPPFQKLTRGREWAHNNSSQQEWLDRHSYSTTKVETVNKIRRKIQYSLHENCHQSRQKLWRLLQKLRTKNIRMEPSRMYCSPWYFSESPRCWKIHPVKKITNVHMHIVLDTAVYKWGSKKTYHQTQEGPFWKAQYKICRPLERRVDRWQQMHECMSPDEPYIGF